MKTLKDYWLYASGVLLLLTSVIGYATTLPAKPAPKAACCCPAVCPTDCPCECRDCPGK